MTGDERAEVEARARALAALERQQRLVRELEHEVEATRGAGGRLGRLAETVLGGTWARDLAVGARSVLRSPARWERSPSRRTADPLRRKPSATRPPDDPLQLELSATRRRVSALAWRLRARRAPRAARARLRDGGHRAVHALRLALAVTGRRAPVAAGTEPVEWVVVGGRLEQLIARAAARRAGAPVRLSRRPTSSEALAAAAEAGRPALVSLGAVVGRPGWLSRMARVLEEDPDLAAVGELGSAVSFDWTGRAPCTVMDGGPGPCAGLAGGTVLLRSGAAAAAPSILDATMAVTAAGGRVAATGERLSVLRADAPGDELFDRWGRVVRRGVLNDLIGGERIWCGPRVPAPSPAARGALADRLRRPCLALRVPGRSRAAAWTTGDTHLALALARALRRRGVHVEIEFTGGPTVAAACCDVLVHLRGRVAARRRPGQPLALWIISHPAGVTEQELRDADHILVASAPFAEAIAPRHPGRVSTLLQFTDTERFAPRPDPALADDVVFVGNWRSRLRPIVWEALQTTHPPVLYGDGWQHVAPERVRARWIDNADLPRVYSSCAVVLNDHWPDMREGGFLSNRLFDALACGAFVISDPVAGLAEQLGDAVETYSGVEDLQRKLDRWLADPAGRRSRARRGRELVLRRHSADVRAGQLLDVLAVTMPRLAHDECDQTASA